MDNRQVTKAPTQPGRSPSTVETAETEKAPARRAANLLAGWVTPPASPAMAQGHAAQLNQAMTGQPGAGAALARQLQQTYGNRYVQ